MHSRAHVFDDILAKGVARNANTEVNENLHGPIKDIYDKSKTEKMLMKRYDNAI